MPIPIAKNNEISPNTNLLCQAIFNGSMEDFLLLLPNATPTENNCYPLSLAVMYGQKEMVELLVPLADPKNNDALRYSKKSTSPDIIKMLLPISSSESCDYFTLNKLARMGNKDCLFLLLDHYTAFNETTRKFLCATYTGNDAVLEELLNTDLVSEEHCSLGFFFALYGRHVSCLKKLLPLRSVALPDLELDCDKAFDAALDDALSPPKRDVVAFFVSVFDFSNVLKKLERDITYCYSSPTLAELKLSVLKKEINVFEVKKQKERLTQSVLEECYTNKGVANKTHQVKRKI